MKKCYRWVGEGETYLAELETSFQSHIDTRSILGNLGDQVRSNGLALDVTVDGVWLWRASRGVFAEDLRGCNGGSSGRGGRCCGQRRSGGDGC